MTTAATHAGFIADICDHPEDDSIRLIYADWLEDHGDPERAEFIRVQVEMHGTLCIASPCEDEIEPRTPYTMFCSNSDCHHCSLDYRGNQLLGYGDPGFENRNERLWGGTGLLALQEEEALPTWEWKRGFLAEIHAPLAVLEKHLAVLVRQHPIERVRVTDKDPARYSEDCFSWWDVKVQGVRDHLDPEDLPSDAWDALNADPDPKEPLVKDFLTAAHAALSEALLRLAKER